MSTVFDFAELESSSEAPAEDVRSHLMKAHSGLAAAIARVLAGEQEIVTDTIVVSFVYAYAHVVKLVLSGLPAALL